MIAQVLLQQDSSLAQFEPQKAQNALNSILQRRSQKMFDAGIFRQLVRRVIDEGYPLTLDNFSIVYQEAIDVLTQKLNNISSSLNEIASKKRTLESTDTTDLTQRYEQRRQMDLLNKEEYELNDARIDYEYQVNELLTPLNTKYEPPQQPSQQAQPQYQQQGSANEYNSNNFMPSYNANLNNYNQQDYNNNNLGSPNDYQEQDNVQYNNYNKYNETYNNTYNNPNPNVFNNPNAFNNPNPNNYNNPNPNTYNNPNPNAFNNPNPNIYSNPNPNTYNNPNPSTYNNPYNISNNNNNQYVSALGDYQFQAPHRFQPANEYQPYQEYVQQQQINGNAKLIQSRVQPTTDNNDGVQQEMDSYNQYLVQQPEFPPQIFDRRYSHHTESALKRSNPPQGQESLQSDKRANSRASNNDSSVFRIDWFSLFVIQIACFACFRRANFLNICLPIMVLFGLVNHRMHSRFFQGFSFMIGLLSLVEDVIWLAVYSDHYFLNDIYDGPADVDTSIRVFSFICTLFNLCFKMIYIPCQILLCKEQTERIIELQVLQ